MKPKPIYWIVFLGILAVGAVFSLRRLLPIYNATVFLLALVAFWNAISLLAGWLPGRPACPLWGQRWWSGGRLSHN